MQPRRRRSGGPFLLLILSSGACVSVPDDELARLEAIRADWSSPTRIDADHAYALPELMEHAIRRDPGLTADFHRYEAALQQVILDGALEDPRVQFGYFIDSVETRVGPQQWRAGVSQTFPFFGKRDLRAEIALHDAHERRERLFESRLRLARDVAAAYWELFELEEARRQTRRHIELLEQLTGSIEARYLTGRATRSDLISIEIEISRLEAELENVEHRVQREIAALNAWLDRDPRAPLLLSFESATATPFSPLDENVVLVHARDFGPIHEQAHRILRMDASVALAELGWFPDVGIGYDYIKTDNSMLPMPDSGKDPQILGFSMNLPLWFDKNVARTERAVRLLESERASRRRLIRTAERDAAAALSRVREAERTRRLNEEVLVGKAEERRRLSEQDYVGGLVDLDQLVDAERDVISIHLEIARRVAARETALADLDYLTGGALGKLPRARPAGAEDIDRATNERELMGIDDEAEKP